MVERESGASRLFNILNYVFLAFIGIICLYPFLYVVFASFSDPNQFIKHDFTVLWAPAGFSLEAYKHVFTGELGSGGFPKQSTFDTRRALGLLYIHIYICRVLLGVL